MACNSLPFDILSVLERDALENRCIIVEMTKTHKSTEKFPFETNQVAEWLLRKYNDYAVGEVVCIDSEQSSSASSDVESSSSSDITHDQFLQPLSEEETNNVNREAFSRNFSSPVLGKRKMRKVASKYSSVKQLKRTAN